MKHTYSAIYQDVCIRPLEKRDIEKLRIWRNDSYKTRFLRQIGEITPKMQEKWYEDYLEDNNIIIFAIEELYDLKRMVGSLALYDFKGNIAEIGKIQIGDTEANGRGIGRKSMVMAMWIGFECLGLKNIVGFVHRDNIAAHSNDMKIGFHITGFHEAAVGGYEDEIEINRQRLMEVNPYVREIQIERKEITYGL